MYQVMPQVVRYLVRAVSCQVLYQVMSQVARYQLQVMYLVIS